VYVQEAEFRVVPFFLEDPLLEFFPILGYEDSGLVYNG
jgi:hypothetical protein